MKKVGFLFLILMFTGLLNLDAQISPSTLTGDTINKMNSDNLKTGYWVERINELTYQGYYVNGKKNGNWVTLFSNNQISRLEYYTMGVKDGISLQIDRKAKLTNVENFKNGELNGTCIYYGPYNENPTKEMNYANGKLDGMVRLFYDNGKIQEESFYKNNLKSGPSKWYNKTGNLIASYAYINGQFEGVQTTYYDNDTVQSVSSYKNNLLSGDYKEMYRNGKIKLQGTYVNGVKEGPWTEFDETGKTVKVTKYKAGTAK